MLDRLMGQETEYALRFSPADQSPGNRALFDALMGRVESMVPALPGARRLSRRQKFLANGGSVYYEFLPYAMDGGLVEAGTPECRGPSSLMLYQVAQDRLLCRAASQVKTELGDAHAGELTLLKNCRDGDGNVYGVQENYEAIVAQGPRLWALRAGIACLLPLLFALLPVVWGVLLALIVGLLAMLLAMGVLDMLLVPLFNISLMEKISSGARGFEQTFGRFEMVLEIALLTPVLVPYALLLRACAFRPHRHALTPFLMSRPIIAGAGTLIDGKFVLSEKAPAIRRLMRLTIAPTDRPVYDTGNLMKLLMGPLLFDWRGLRGLFRVRQRLQLGLADANRCQVAEMLKLGTTALVLDMAEAGFLDDAPTLRDPLAALAAFTGDPVLQASAEDTAGRTWTALDLQQFFLDRARDFAANAPASSMEAFDIIRLWGEALDALRTEPGRLIGRVDWITKRYLLSTAGRDADADTRKKIDLRYHELGENGYLTWLEQDGLAPTLVTDIETEHAIVTPPADSPAALRGRLIRQLAADGLPGVASWDAVRSKGPDGKRNVVSLADWRRDRESK